MTSATRGGCEAITRKWGAEVGELREQIAGKQKEIEALQAKTAVHLAALSDLEGVPYTDEILRSANRTTSTGDMCPVPWPWSSKPGRWGAA